MSIDSESYHKGFVKRLLLFFILLWRFKRRDYQVLECLKFRRLRQQEFPMTTWPLSNGQESIFPLPFRLIVEAFSCLLTQLKTIFHIKF